MLRIESIATYYMYIRFEGSKYNVLCNFLMFHFDFEIKALRNIQAVYLPQGKNKEFDFWKYKCPCHRHPIRQVQDLPVGLESLLTQTRPLN